MLGLPTLPSRSLTKGPLWLLVVKVLSELIRWTSQRSLCGDTGDIPHRNGTLTVAQQQSLWIALGKNVILWMLFCF